MSHQPDKEVLNRLSRYAVILGLVFMVIYAALNFLKFERFSSNLPEMSMAAVVNFMIMLVGLFIVARLVVRQNGGIFDLKLVFRTLFMIILFYELGNIISNYYYMFHFNPDFTQEFHDRNAEWMMTENKHWDDTQKKETLDAILNQQQHSFGSYILLYFREVVFSSIFGFIITFITKFLNRKNTIYVYPNQVNR